MTSTLSINNLVTEFNTDEGRVRAIDDVSFCAKSGKTLGIVGESGCGKSVTALSIMRLLPQPMGRIVSGSIKLNGEDLTKITNREMEKVRGARISMIFQEPMSALNPVHTIGRQLAEIFLVHEKITPDAATKKCIELLDRVGIPSPEIRMTEYPHQLSGGMRQRVVIAIALACKPDFLIADEPTTALDVTIQAQILELIKELQSQTGMSLILITHDLGVIAETCDEVMVMYAGKVAEIGNVFDIFDHSKHPYTRGLLKSIPTLNTKPKSPLTVIEGMVPRLLDLKNNCHFNNRCIYSTEECLTTPPSLKQVKGKHQVSCLRWEEI